MNQVHSTAGEMVVTVLVPVSENRQALIIFSDDKSLYLNRAYFERKRGSYRRYLC